MAVFDLIVIGGGVNGAAIARDAAGRGGKVLLLEARDLANGTSSASTKLVHGGLRYLEYREFALVREALHERETLWRIAPHIIRPMRFVLPHQPGLRPRWMLRAGLMLYDMLAGRSAWPRARSIRLADHPAGEPLDPALAHGFEYSDGWVDDARLVVLHALDAAERGAQILTRTPVTAARREGDGWVVETPAGSFRGHGLVNAAGPGADDVARLTGITPRYSLRRVRGSHIIVPRLFDHPYAYIFQQADTRIIFAIPYEGQFTLIGTTDRDHTGSLTDVHADEGEIAYLCAAANGYFRTQLTPAAVVASYSGVRALVDDGSGRPEAATRGYRLPLSPASEGAPLLDVLGGKITSCRHLAQSAVDLLATRLPALVGEAWTARVPLPGGDFVAGTVGDQIAALQAAYPFLDDAQASRITCAYGTRAERWLGHARAYADLGRDFGAGLSEAELTYLRDVEWARTAEDALWRRSKRGLHMSADQRQSVADWFGQ